MKTFLASLSALLCCILLMGAVGFDAPLMPSMDFYVNDHAGVIGQQERDEMLKNAREIYETKDVRAVVLTIESYGGLEPVDYAERIFNSWQLGEAHGAIGAKGVLILLCTEERHIVAMTNTDINIKARLEAAEALLAEGKFSDAISSCFLEMAADIYTEEHINGGAKALFIEPERLPFDLSYTVPNQNTQNTRKTQNTSTMPDGSRKGNSNQLAITVGIAGLIIFTTFATYKKTARISRNSSYYTGYYQKMEYESLTARHDDDDYPTGFGGVGNRKAIYGEDVDEADDIRIIKRGGKTVADAGKTKKQQTSDFQ